MLMDKRRKLNILITLAACVMFCLTILRADCSWAVEKNDNTISAKELWNSQYLYFQNISSLEFHSTMELMFSEEMKQKQKLPVEKLEITMDFSLDGNKYRSEVSFLDVSVGKKDKSITAYNGQLYQIFQANAASLTVSKSTENMMILRYNPYMGMIPILVPFGFAFHITPDVRFVDQLSIDTLKKPEVWSRLVKDSGEVHQTNMNNHDGVSITGNSNYMDIIISDENWPIYGVHYCHCDEQWVNGECITG